MSLNDAKARMYAKYDKKADRSSDFMWRFIFLALLLYIAHGDWWWAVWAALGFAALNVVGLVVYLFLRDKHD